MGAEKARHGHSERSESKARDGGDPQPVLAECRDTLRGRCDAIEPDEAAMYLLIQRDRIRCRHEAIAQPGKKPEADFPFQLREHAAGGRL